MSLSFDEIVEVHREWAEMDERLNKLIGFNPATSNHYGIIQLYNQRIDANTSDNEIIKIRTDYLNWKKEIVAILYENDLVFDDEQFNKLFSVDGMYGTLTFLGVAVDIHQKTDVYRDTVKCLLNEIDRIQKAYENKMEGLKK